MVGLSTTGMRVLREVARQGSFSAAAEALGYTQSAVSRQVALAESVAGRELFRRHARGVEPTGAGTVVLRHATAALAELEAARNELEDLASRRAVRVRLGAFSTAMASLVPRAAAALEGDEDPIELVLREGTSPRLLTSVASGRMDIAVVTVPADPPEGVLLEELLHDPLLLAVPRGHSLTGASQVDPESLRDERWIAGSSDPATTLLGAWSTGGWRPRIAFEVRDWTAKLGLVAGGCGVTIVPGLIAAALPATISVVAIDHPRAVRTIALARRDAAEPTGALDRVCSALREALAVPALSRR